MSELTDRMQHEGEFARRLSRLSGRHRRELLDLLGSPPDASRVPDEFWERVERERRQELLTALLLIWLLSQEQHAGELLPDPVATAVGPALGDVGRAWAGKRAEQTARGNTETARERLAMRAKDWEELGDAVTEEQVAADVTDAFSPASDAVTAATETTAAVTAATVATVQAGNSQGFRLTTRWNTERDDLVCPVCRPLHKLVPDLWGPVLETLVAPGGMRAIESIAANGGPPAHPNCRCWLTTQAEPTAQRRRS